MIRFVRLLGATAFLALVLVGCEGNNKGKFNIPSDATSRPKNLPGVVGTNNNAAPPGGVEKD